MHPKRPVVLLVFALAFAITACAEIVPGDVDGNLAVDAQDLLKTAHYLAGNLPRSRSGIPINTGCPT